MKYTYCSTLYFFISLLHGSANHHKIEKNAYGDPIIVISDECSQKELLDTIKSIERSFFVDLPYKKAAFAELLIKEQGFSFYHGNNDRVRLIKRLDVDIPNPFTCNSGAKVLITRKIGDVLYALFTKEKGRKFATWPGGMLNPGERIVEAAVRELKEELDIQISPEALRFFGVLQRIGIGYGATHHQYVFHTWYDGQEITPDGKEILDIIWVPITKALNGTVCGMPIRDHKKKVLRAIQNGVEGTPIEHLHDFRQYDKKGIDKTDTMDFYTIITNQSH